jgi:hypothetical protein
MQTLGFKFTHLSSLVVFYLRIEAFNRDFGRTYSAKWGNEWDVPDLQTVVALFDQIAEWLWRQAPPSNPNRPGIRVTAIEVMFSAAIIIGIDIR